MQTLGMSIEETGKEESKDSHSLNFRNLFNCNIVEITHGKSSKGRNDGSRIIKAL